MDKYKTCKGCPDRHNLCGVSYDGYKKRRRTQDAKNALRRQEQKIDEYVHDQVMRGRKKDNFLILYRGGYDCGQKYR